MLYNPNEIINYFNESRKGDINEFKKNQKDIWQNKVNKGFNITDVNKEFCLL